MNWFIDNYFSLTIFGVTIIAAASSFISSDKRKKTVGFTVAFLGALFTLINTINTHTQSKRNSNRADSLQRIISNKADLITRNQNLQYTSFTKQFQLQLDTLKRVNSDLSILKLNSEHLNDSLTIELKIQKTTNEKTTQLFKVQQHNDSVAFENNKHKFMNTLNLIDGISNSLVYRNPAFSKDSIGTEKYINQSATKILDLLNSQSDNPVLYSDSVLLKNWNIFQDDVYSALWKVNGYQQFPISETATLLYSSTMNFHNKVIAYFYYTHIATNK